MFLIVSMTMNRLPTPRSDYQSLAGFIDIACRVHTVRDCPIAEYLRRKALRLYTAWGAAIKAFAGFSTNSKPSDASEGNWYSFKPKSIHSEYSKK